MEMTEDLIRNVIQQVLSQMGTGPSMANGSSPKPSGKDGVYPTADAAVVASVLIETLAASLDADGRAGPDTVRKVLDQVRALADGVRGARLRDHAA